MISVVQGRVGSCKSYFCTKTAIAHLRAGGVVATNMEIDLSAVRRIYHRRIASWQLIRVDATSDPCLIPRGDFRGHGKRRVLVILDEALNWFASEGQANAKDERKVLWSKWLRQSDKLGQDVWFVAQSFERAAKWIRELSQICYDCHNFGQTSLFGMPVGKWLRLGRLAVVSKWDVRAKSRLGWRFVTLSPLVWDCYETSELYGFHAADSAFVSTVWPAYNPPAAWLVLVPVLWSVCFVVWEFVL